MERPFMFNAPGLAFCLCLAILLASAVPALAGGSVSPESCEKVGTINVKCLKCDTGDYVGTVVVDAKYDASFESCMGNYRLARERCAGASGLEQSQIGMKWDYWISGTKYYNHWPNNCTY